MGGANVSYIELVLLKTVSNAPLSHKPDEQNQTRLDYAVVRKSCANANF